MWISILLAVLVHVAIASMLLLDDGQPRDLDPTATMGAGPGAVTLEPGDGAAQPGPTEAQRVPPPGQELQAQQPQPFPQPEPPSGEARQGRSVAGPVTSLPADITSRASEPPPEVMAALSRPGIGAPPEPAPRPEPEQATQRAAPPASAPSPRAPERGNQRAAPARPTQLAVQPSFDCRQARSTVEKMICSDAELARLDRDLGRLYARARSASRDPAAFRRQQQVEWRRREQTCKSRDCLIEWYARRRQQLSEIIAVAPSGDARRQRTQ